MTKITTAMVLAAGLGTRMRPLTDDRPKALVEVAGRALIDHMLDRLAAAGVTRAVVNVHHFADKVETHLAARTGGPEILISDERGRLLETGGGLKHARPLLGEEPVLVANIDSVWTETGHPAVPALIEAFDPARMDICQLLAPTRGAIGYDRAGDFFLAEDGVVTPRGEAAFAPYTQMGVHITKPGLVYAWPGEAFGLFDLWMRTARAGRMHGIALDGQWMHVGDPAARDQSEAFLHGRVDFIEGGGVNGPGFLAGDGPRWFTIPAQRPFLIDLARGCSTPCPARPWPRPWCCCPPAARCGCWPRPLSTRLARGDDPAAGAGARRP